MPYINPHSEGGDESIRRREREREKMSTESPPQFLCPISRDIMSDPVMISTGHTFDRSSIEQWLDSGNRTCPITRVHLGDHPPLIPNLALRSLISDSLRSPTPSSRPDQEPSPLPGALLANLASPWSPLESKPETLTHLTEISHRDRDFRRWLTSSGEVSVVLNCVDPDNGLLRERALSLLLDLSSDNDNKVGWVDQGAISKIVRVLRADSTGCPKIAAKIITSLAVAEVNKATIGEHPSAIRALILLLRDGNGEEKEEAATALLAICSFPENRKRAAANGSVEILIRAVALGLEKAVEVLAMLANCPEGREQMASCDGCVSVLVKVLGNGGCEGVKYALPTLHSLCCCSRKIRAEAKSQRVLDMCTTLSRHDNLKIRSSANGLARCLRARSQLHSKRG